MMRSLLVLAFLVLYIAVVAQQDLRSAIKKELDSKEVWIDTYTGLLDDVHTIEIAVGHNAHDEAGIVRMPSSGLVLNMDAAVHRDNYIELIKTTTYGDTLYHLEMDCIASKCKGTWKTPSSPEALSIVAYESQTSLPCERMHYLQLYRTGSDELVQVSRKNQVITIDLDKHTFEGKCIDAQCSRISFDSIVYKNNSYQKAYYMRNARSSTLLLESPQGMGETVTLLGDKKLSYICESYIDHNKRYSIQLPHIEGSDLLAYCKKKTRLPELKRIKSSEESMYDVNQYESIAYTWCDITYFDGSIISGFINSQSSADGKIKEQSFIYDIVEGEEIPPQKLFSKRIRKLVSLQKYPHVVMEKDHFVFATAFDPIYGVEKQEMSYSEAARYLRNKRLKKHLK